MDELNHLATQFENYLKSLGRAQKTIKEALRKLTKFIVYLHAKSITQAVAISGDTVRDYQVFLYQNVNAYGRVNSVAYQNGLLSVVKQFLDYLAQTGHIMAAPSQGLSYAKTPQRLPTSVLTPAEVHKILKMPDVNSAIGYRDRTILEVFYSSGIRKTELRNLSLPDVDYHEGLLKVTGKGGKDRVVPVGRIACRYLQNYIKAVRPMLQNRLPNDIVFLSSRGNRLNHNAVWVLVKKYAKLAGIKKNVHCHTFRHTCATALVKNKADLRSVQKLLGHANLSTTQVYTHLTISDLKKVHARCHPREQEA